MGHLADWADSTSLQLSDIFKAGQVDRDRKEHQETPREEKSDLEHVKHDPIFI